MSDFMKKISDFMVEALWCSLMRVSLLFFPPNHFKISNLFTDFYSAVAPLEVEKPVTIQVEMNGIIDCGHRNTRARRGNCRGEVKRQCVGEVYRRPFFAPVDATVAACRVHEGSAGESTASRQHLGPGTARLGRAQPGTAGRAGGSMDMKRS